MNRDAIKLGLVLIVWATQSVAMIWTPLEKSRILASWEDGKVIEYARYFTDTVSIAEFVILIDCKELKYNGYQIITEYPENNEGDVSDWLEDQKPIFWLLAHHDFSSGEFDFPELENFAKVNGMFALYEDGNTRGPLDLMEVCQDMGMASNFGWEKR